MKLPKKFKVYKDVPQQYKPLTDMLTLDLMRIARRLMPVIEELGSSFECTDA